MNVQLGRSRRTRNDSNYEGDRAANIYLDRWEIHRLQDSMLKGK